MEAKITKKMKFEGMIAYFKGEDTDLTETQFIEFCEEQIADLDKKAAKAKERAAAKRAEADELQRMVEGVLTEEYQTVADIAEQVLPLVTEDMGEVSTQKIISRITKLVEAQVAEKKQVTVETEGKKRKCMAYRLAEIACGDPDAEVEE